MRINEDYAKDVKYKILWEKMNHSRLKLPEATNIIRGHKLNDLLLQHVF